MKKFDVLTETLRDLSGADTRAKGHTLTEERKSKGTVNEMNTNKDTSANALINEFNTQRKRAAYNLYNNAIKDAQQLILSSAPIERKYTPESFFFYEDIVTTVRILSDMRDGVNESTWVEGFASNVVRLMNSKIVTEPCKQIRKGLVRALVLDVATPLAGIEALSQEEFGAIWQAVYLK